jgi:transposase
MSLREEFVCLAGQEGANRWELCRRFGISPQTAYKWLARYANERKAGLLDRSRRPQFSPVETPAEVQAAVVDLRREHPAWGGRKISRCLQDLGRVTVAPSTVSSILHRHGLIAPPAAEDKAWQRFEHEFPNALWQADFKEYFETLQGRCSPLTMLSTTIPATTWCCEPVRICPDSDSGDTRSEWLGGARGTTGGASGATLNRAIEYFHCPAVWSA